MDIFISGSLTHIKLRKSEIYITRLFLSYWIDGVLNSELHYFESDNPEINSLNALDNFVLNMNKFKANYPNEVFSSVKINRDKYRCFDVITSLEMNNLIKTKKGN